MLLRLIAVLFLLVGTTTGALAHAGLISADPADGSVLAREPAGIALIFTEAVSPIGFSVVGLDGTPTPLNADKQDGANVHVPLPLGLASGSYLFSWRVTSEDGHPVNGTIGFAIGAPSGTISAAGSDTVLVASVWAVRALLYIALFLGVGSAAFGGLQPLPPGVRRTSRILALAGLALVPAALALQGADLLGLPLGGALTPAAWSEAIGSPYAQTEALFALAFVLALLPSRIAVIAAGLAGALGPSLSGHASTASPQILMRAMVFAHMASLMFWLGSLVPLIGFLRAGEAQALRRFSRIIPWVIGLLLLSGITLAVVQLGPPRADWASPYGLLLLGKLALVTVLLLIALWNRLRLTARAQAGDTRPLRRAIAAELVLVAMILGIVAGWRFTPPPRVLAEIEVASAPLGVTLKAGDSQAGMQVTPGHPGPVSLEIELPVAAQEVTVMLENPGADIATIGKKAVRVDGNIWRIDGLLLPAGGDWPVGVQARTGKFDVTTFTGTLSFDGKDNTMNTATKAAAAALASSMLLAAPVQAAGVLPSCAIGQSFAQGAITVTGAFSRATPPKAQSAGGYLTIRNSGPAADTLVSVASEAAKDVSIHQMRMNGNVMEMSAVEGGLPIPAGGTVSLDPMGYHLMLTGMDVPFVEGECIAMVLHFAQAGDLPVELNVGSVAQQTPLAAAAPTASSAEMSGMDMGSMPGMSSAASP